MTGFLINGGNLDTEADRHTGRIAHEDNGRDWCHVSTSQEHQKSPANHQTLEERHGTDTSAQASGGTNPANTLISNFSPPELWGNMFLRPSLWHFVMAALGN